MIDNLTTQTPVLTVGSDYSGVGAFEHAMNYLGIKTHNQFVCDFDKYARKSWMYVHGTEEDKVLVDSKEHNTICDKVKKILDPDRKVKELSDKEIEYLQYANDFAKQFSVYFPFNVYDRDIPQSPLDFYMTSPPCQSFSLAGKRLGKLDKRGILFFNSLELIQTNNPRFFVFENVKGLLSHDNGVTFSEWINLLGGKSVNGLPVLFPYEDSVPYHIYWQVLNSKKHGTPQNRERVFIIGIRDDEDNAFEFPKEEHLEKRLKDVLEEHVDEKYFLSDKMVSWLLTHTENSKQKGSGFKFSAKEPDDVANSINARCFKMGIDDNYIEVKTEPNQPFIRQKSRGHNKGGDHDVCPPITSNSFEQNNILFEPDLNKNNEAIIGTWRTHKDGQGFRQTEDNNCPTIPARAREDGSGQPVVCIPVLTPDRPEKKQNGRRFKEDGDPSFTLTAQDRHGIYDGYRIRRLTPLECFRLMAFPNSHVEICQKHKMSDSQLYKQAGNSIDALLLSKIIKNIKYLHKR